jgi:hypothetical protein
MPQSEADVAGLELERVRTKVPVLFDREDKLYSMLEKKNVEVISNREMRCPLEISPGGSPGAWNPDGGGLGRGSASKFDKAVISAVHFKHAVEWTKMTEWVTDNNRKAVLNNVRYQLAKGMKEARRHLNALCHTDGTGVIATATTYAVGGGLAGADRITASGDGFGAKFVRTGQKVNVYNSTLAANRTFGAEREVTGFVDLENKIFDITPSLATGANGDKIVFSGLTATPPVYMLGVPYHFSNAATGTWLGFNRANFPQIRANRVNAGGALALPFARLAMNKAGNRVGEDEVKKVIAYMHPAQVDAYEQLGQAVMIIQKQAKAEGLNQYFSPGENMQLAGAPVKSSYFQDMKRIDFLPLDVFGRAVMHEADFYEEGGRHIFEARSPDGGVAAAALFYIVVSMNLFVENPALCSYIDGLTIPSGY